MPCRHLKRLDLPPPEARYQLLGFGERAIDDRPLLAGETNTHALGARLQTLAAQVSPASASSSLNLPMSDSSLFVRHDTDEMHIAIAPVILGNGEHLLHGIDTPGLGYACTAHVTTDHATHFVLTKQR